MMMMRMVMRMVADVMVVGVDTVVVISEGMEVVGGNGRVNVITLPTITCL